MTNGILLALAAYATFSFGDACIKALGGQLSIFEIGFFSTLFAGFFLLFAKPRQERWRDFLRMQRPWLVQARALSGLGAGLLGIVAFTSIPFAEAYALIFLSPLFVTLLSVARAEGGGRRLALGDGARRVSSASSSWCGRGSARSSSATSPPSAWR